MLWFGADATDPAQLCISSLYPKASAKDLIWIGYFYRHSKKKKKKKKHKEQHEVRFEPKLPLTSVYINKFSSIEDQIQNRQQ